MEIERVRTGEVGTKSETRVESRFKSGRSESKYPQPETDQLISAKACYLGL